MTLNVVNKGKDGEREVVRSLDRQLEELIIENRWAETDPDMVGHLREVVQRNQNQSAAGGGDINVFGVSIEVKRQEALSIETWWKQCKASCARNGDLPVLLFRQNRKGWRCIMEGALMLGTERYVGARVEVSFDSFLMWFKYWALKEIQAGRITRR